MSGGVGLLDYDGDGWLDVYCRPGGPVPTRPDRPRTPATGSSATGATAPSRMSPPPRASPVPRGYGHGVAVGDYDNDGHPDLFVTRWRSYALYRNQGDGTFRGRDRGGGPGRRPRLADLGGLRRPGRRRRPRPLRLPLPGVGRRAPADLLGRGEEADTATVRPSASAIFPDHLFRNDGGRFVDVTEQAGINDWHGQGLGVVATDLDDDGRVDLFVANDQSPNYLLPQPRAACKFEEVARELGPGRQRQRGLPGEHGRRLRRPRRRRPARPGRHQLLQRVDDLLSQPGRRGLRRPHRRDRAGRPDALPARVRHRVPRRRTTTATSTSPSPMATWTTSGPRSPTRCPPSSSSAARAGRLTDVSDRAGRPGRSRGSAAAWPRETSTTTAGSTCCSLAQDVPLAYFHNRSKAGHFADPSPGRDASNRDAIGARVTVTAGGRRQAAWRFGGGSYQSSSDPRLHFGLGDATGSTCSRWPGRRGKSTVRPARGRHRLPAARGQG